MNNYEIQKLKEVVLYILNKTEGLDFYRIFKVLYFAEREHLKSYGTRIVADVFCALPYGPVPDTLYKAIKVGSFADVCIIAGEDASNVLLPSRASDLDYLSASDMASLDASIAENARLTFAQLKEKSHDLAWQRAGHCGQIKPADMARASGASEAVIDYIIEQEALEASLR